MKKFLLFVLLIILTIVPLIITVSAETGTCELIEIDRTTRGEWVGNYGKSGYQIASQDDSNLPMYVESIFANASKEPLGGTHTWYKESDIDEDLISDTELNTINERKPGTLYIDSNKSDRIAACYVGNTIGVLVDVGGNTEQVSIYALDYDAQNRITDITVYDNDGNVLIPTFELNNFAMGAYLKLKVTGKIFVEFVNMTAGQNAVISGIFFDNMKTGAAAIPGDSENNAESAPVVAEYGACELIGMDINTRGNWGGVYGNDGYQICDGRTALPAYVKELILSKNFVFTWGSENGGGDYWDHPNTAGIDGYKLGASAVYDGGNISDRIAAGYIDNDKLTVDVNVGNNTKIVSLYALDWGNDGRDMDITVYDDNGNILVPNFAFGNYADGVYVSFKVTGKVKIDMIKTAAGNISLSGIFFDSETIENEKLTAPEKEEMAENNNEINQSVETPNNPDSTSTSNSGNSSVPTGDNLIIFLVVLAILGLAAFEIIEKRIRNITQNK